MLGHIISVLRKPKLTKVRFVALLLSIGLASYFVHAQIERPILNTSSESYGPTPVDADTGEIFAIHHVGDTLLISSEKGLLRWNDKLQGKPEIASLSASPQFGFLLLGDTILLGTAAGLFRWNVRLEGRPEPVDVTMGLPLQFLHIGDAVVIGAETGLYRWNESLAGKPELIDESIVMAGRFHQYDDVILFGTRKGGIYKWNTRLEGKPGPSEFPRFRVLYKTGENLLLGTLDGLLRWNTRSEGNPEPVRSHLGGIVRIHHVGANLLISADNGLYQWNDRLEGEPIPIDPTIQTVLAVHQIGDTLLLGGTEGVYRWNIQLNGRPALLFPEAKGVADIRRLAGALLIDSSVGLYRWNERLEGRPENLGEGFAAVYFTHQAGNTILIGGAGGLYQWNDRLEGLPKPVITAMGEVHSFHRNQKDLLIGSDQGLYRWNERLEGEPQLVDSSFGRINCVYQIGPTLLLGVDQVFYQWNEKFEGRAVIDGQVGGPIAFFQIGETLLVSSDRGTYRWDDKLETEPVDLNLTIGEVSAFYRVGNVLLVGGAGGLFRWNDELKGQPELLEGAIGTIHSFQQNGNTLLIGGQRGLFKIGGIGTPWKADIEVDPPAGRTLSNDAIVVRWRIGNYEQRASPQNVGITVIIRDKDGAVISQDGAGNRIAPEQLNVPKGVHQLTLTNGLPAGKYSVTVFATDLTGNTSESEPVTFRVYASLEEFALDWGKYLAFIYAALTILVFVTLVIGARWSKKCFDLLTDPLIRKFGIYFGFALRHVRPIRLWVFERYFDELKKDWSVATVYVPYHLIPVDPPSDGVLAKPIESTDVTDRLRIESHVLILGGPGTGKSALASNLMHTYCREVSLRAAWRMYGFIPVVVRLRELAGSQAIKVPELVGLALDGKGMTFNLDDPFLSSLLRSGDFLIILDGLNEVNVDEAVDAFAITHSSVRLLATSQTDSLSVTFKRYILPFFDATFAQVLLRHFVGDAPAEKAIKAVPELWSDIKCGYDIRLVEYLIKSASASDQPLVSAGDNTTLPRNRLELYQAMIHFSQRRYEQNAIQTKPFPSVRICERAWHMWRNGEYLFQPDQSLPQPDIEHLVKTNIVIKRVQGFEFMHTLMRDFLGAEFCSRHSGPTKLMIQTRFQGAEAEKIWTLPPSDQASVLLFLAQSMERVDELEQLFQFASAKVEERHQMLIAVQEAAEKKRWHIRVNIDA